MSEQLSDDELDLLADLLAGEGSEDDVARVQASPRLAQALAELEAADAAVAADLARLGAVEPPAGFAARLQEALAAEVEPPSRSAVAGTGPAPLGYAPLGSATAHDVVPLAGRREARAPQRGPWMLRAAAGVAGLLVLGGVGTAVLQGSGGGDADQSAAALPEAAASAVAGGQVPTSASGRDYQAAGSLQQALPSLLTGTAAAPSTALDSGGGGGTSDRGAVAGGSTGGSVTGGSSGGSATGALSAPQAESLSSTALDRLRDPAALQACLTALELDPATVPEALDYARYAGQPALVVVLAVPARPAQVEAYVVGPACGQGTDALLFFGRLDRP